MGTLKSRALCSEDVEVASGCECSYFAKQSPRVLGRESIEDGSDNFMRVRPKVFSRIL